MVLKDNGEGAFEVEIFFTCAVVSVFFCSELILFETGRGPAGLARGEKLKLH